MLLNFQHTHKLIGHIQIIIRCIIVHITLHPNTFKLLKLYLANLPHQICTKIHKVESQNFLDPVLAKPES